MSSISIVATVTNEGRQRQAEMTISGRSFQIQKFVIGRGGHDAGDPEQAVSPIPEIENLPLQTFGPKLLIKPDPINTGIAINDFCTRFTGLLDFSEANGQISSVGLIAKIVYSPILGDPLLGREFLFAYGNRPLLIKTDADQLTINIDLKT